MKLSAIILGGGRGIRFGGEVPKQFRKVHGKPILLYTIESFLNCPGIEEILLVLPRDRIAWIRSLEGWPWDAGLRVVAGGETRQQSSAAGVDEAKRSSTHVLIHDAVRPLVPGDLLDRLITALSMHDAVTPVAPVNDTLVRIARDGMVTGFPNRDEFGRVQTPQGFRAEVIRDAHSIARKREIVDATDDCSLVKMTMNIPIAVVDGDERNMKITSPADLDMIQQWLICGETGVRDTR